MRTDVAGRVRNTILAASKPLLPLYEAVVNSLQAVDDANEKKGFIKVRILRSGMPIFGDQKTDLGDITGFEITDNGIGFTDENFRAFETADTTHKVKLGGKGIGRFLWLVAFDRVEVTSTFGSENKLSRRTFEFVPQADGIRKMVLSLVPTGSRTTTVSLVGFRDKYKKQCPKKLQTIAAYMTEHCLEYFIRPSCPSITIEDQSTGEILKLNDLFEREIAATSKVDRVTLDGNKFDVLHVRLYSSHVVDHLMHFCANNRVVKSEKLLGKLPNLSRRLHDEKGQDFVYASYVDSELLDEAVNAERTDFSISENDEGLLIKEPTWKNIREAVFKSCQRFLAPYTEPVRKAKRERIDTFVSGEGPMYRPILKYIETTLDLIDPEIGDDALDIELYQAYHKVQVEMKLEGQTLIQNNNTSHDLAEYEAGFKAYFEKVSDINKSDLARFVCHRKALLQFLQKQLSLNKDGKYQLEKSIHQIIFPMGSTSADVPIDDHNLWVLDEKLAYHTFLASDKPLNTNPHVEIKSSSEPDLLVFDKACAFAPAAEPPFPAVVIIEFKRPMRNDYNDKDNPVKQVLDYVSEIRSGKAKTPTGRPVFTGKDTPFFCYVVADMTQSLVDQVKLLDLIEMPDGQGYFGFRKQFNAYVEVVTYSKIISDAQKRNASFFRTLGLPDRI